MSQPLVAAEAMFCYIFSSKTGNEWLDSDWF